jgi:ribosomal protein S18 acetylase RimI-like enzyme
MSSTTPLEMLDLRHFTGRQLSSLLAAECRVWRERLRWDFSGSATLLEQYIDARVLPGIAALDRGRIVGYAFCIYEGHKAIVGDSFAVETRDADAATNTRAVLGNLLEMLDHSPGLHRIESQLLLFPDGEIDAAFRERDYQLHRRLFMERDLIASPPLPAAASADGIDLWDAECYQPTAELIQSAYRNNTDAEINDQYRTLHGTLRFLHNIVRFPGCGAFDPDCSFVARQSPPTRSGNDLHGAILVSRISPSVAHIAQLCVHPEARRLGLGERLIQRALAQLAVNGYTHATLTVTESNQDAVRLYRRLDFVPTHFFHAATRVVPEQNACNLHSLSS